MVTGKPSSVAVLGGGPFGQALAQAIVRAGNRVVVWTRGGWIAPEGVQQTHDLQRVAGCELIFVAVPSERTADCIPQLGQHLTGEHLMVHVSRGLLGSDLKTVTEVIREHSPSKRVGVLAGPLVADALRKGAPAGAVVGSRFPEVSRAVREAIGGPKLQLHSTEDVIGAEVAAAAVGVVTVMAGLVSGLGLGHAALAVLCTRGIVESSQVGVARGGEHNTFMGLAGLGDLISAITARDRPELSLGHALSDGTSVHEAAREAGTHIEGTQLAAHIAAYAKRRGIPHTITEGVAQVVSNHRPAREVVHQLLAQS